jgi:hypothetical protein
VDNSIPATAFKDMKALRAPGEREENETEKGLRVSDRGFLNTAVLRSQITFIDGEAGGTSSCSAETNSMCAEMLVPQFCGTGIWISCYFTLGGPASNSL